MPRNEQDPAASTQQFRAFADRRESAKQGSNPGVLVGAVAVVVVVVAVIAILALG